MKSPPPEVVNQGIQETKNWIQTSLSEEIPNMRSLPPSLYPSSFHLHLHHIPTFEATSSCSPAARSFVLILWFLGQDSLYLVLLILEKPPLSNLSLQNGQTKMVQNHLHQKQIYQLMELTSQSTFLFSPPWPFTQIQTGFPVECTYWLPS